MTHGDGLKYDVWITGRVARLVERPGGEIVGRHMFAVRPPQFRMLESVRRIWPDVSRVQYVVDIAGYELISPSAVVALIRGAIVRSGKTQAAIARQAGVTPAYLCLVLSGRKPPSRRLCKMFGIVRIGRNPGFYLPKEDLNHGQGKHARRPGASQPFASLGI